MVATSRLSLMLSSLSTVVCVTCVVVRVQALWTISSLRLWTLLCGGTSPMPGLLTCHATPDVVTRLCLTVGVQTDGSEAFDHL
jgi:hypothetical protein